MSQKVLVAGATGDTPSTEAIMTYVDTLLRRNDEFAGDGFNPNLRMMPSSKSLIIGCVDPRVDPANIFKLERGRLQSSVTSAAG
jgi:hypothetical protein